MRVTVNMREVSNAKRFGIDHAGKSASRVIY